MNDGAPPRPDPKAIRASIVDSGWSVPPPSGADVPPVERLPSTRALPSYEEQEGGAVRDVTIVDREIHSRAKAMRDKDTLPPPRRASSFPPAPAPPPPRTRPPPPPPPVVVRSPDIAPPPPPPPPPPALPRSVPPSYSLPPSPGEGHEPHVSAARSAATLVRARPSLGPAAMPSFTAALRQRVRFAGGEVPLWSLVTPLVLLVALGAAFAAAAVTSATDPDAPAQASSKLAPEPSASAAAQLPAPVPPPPVVSASPEEKPKELSLLEKVALGDDLAVKALSAKPAADLRVAEAISLSLGQSAQAVRAARALRERIDHDPGLIKAPDVLEQLRRSCDDPETSRDALAAIASVPGPISPDLIYEVWTATSTRSAATDLARSLIYSKEVRAKASKALSVALDLRDADTCEKNRDLLPRATNDGDRRSFHLLNKLTRKYGCGPGKRQDCYACLRDGKDLDAALKAVKARHEPHPFGG